jgi:hypothetical protein
VAKKARRVGMEGVEDSAEAEGFEEAEGFAGLVGMAFP